MTSEQSGGGVGPSVEMRMAFWEFVVYVAACMAINALAIDIILPALPAMSAALSLVSENDRQNVVLIYVLGLGVSQLFFGPLADRFGRRPVLLLGFTIFAGASVACAAAFNFALLLLARLVQGIGAGAARALSISLVRDRFSGNEMGRVMSLVMMVFMIVPILAPSLGQLILFVAPWRWVFATLFLSALGLFFWTLLRLRESVRPEARLRFSVASVLGAYLQTFRNPMTLGYALAMGVVMGCLMAFIATAQQVFQDVYEVGAGFTLLFALIALFISVASFLNSRAVMRFGLRRVGHVALVGFVGTAALFSVLAWRGLLGLEEFIVLQGLLLFCFGFLGANFNALAMQPMGDIAGTAAAMVGFLSTTLGAVLGHFVGDGFDGSMLPLGLGYLGLGLLALLIAFVVRVLSRKHPVREVPV